MPSATREMIFKSPKKQGGLYAYSKHLPKNMMFSNSNEIIVISISPPT